MPIAPKRLKLVFIFDTRSWGQSGHDPFNFFRKRGRLQGHVTSKFLGVTRYYLGNGQATDFKFGTQFCTPIIILRLTDKVTKMRKITIMKKFTWLRYACTSTSAF